RPAPPVLARPMQPCPTAVVQPPTPPPQERNLARRRLGLRTRRPPPPRGQVREQPLATLALKARLLVAQPKIHRRPATTPPDGTPRHNKDAIRDSRLR